MENTKSNRQDRQDVQEKQERLLADVEDLMPGKISPARLIANDLERGLEKGPVQGMKTVMTIFTAVATTVFDMVPADVTDHGMALLLEDIVKGFNRTARYKTTVSIKKLVEDNAALQAEVATLRQRCDTLETALGKEEA